MSSRTVKESQQYYDARFGGLSQQLNEEETIRITAIEIAIGRLALQPGCRIADFGCGRGWLSSRLAKYGVVTGFDLSEKAVANARASFPTITFETLNATDELPATYVGAFDVLVSSEVIEHVDDQKKYLIHAAAMLNPGGKLLLTTPDGRWKSIYFSGTRAGWGQPLEHWIDAGAAGRLLSETGFSEITIRSFNAEWMYDLQPKIPFAAIAAPAFRKIQKAVGLYRPMVRLLNTAGYGLNLLITAVKR